MSVDKRAPIHSNIPTSAVGSPLQFDAICRPCCAVTHGSADLELILPMHCKAEMRSRSPCGPAWPSSRHWDWKCPKC